MTITFKGSPNYDKNRTTINRIVIHWFGTGTLESANARFQDKNSQVSAHYGISGKRVWQWVKEEYVAYHAGNYAMNQRSIGIEHDATTEHNASEDTYQTSAKLIADICRRYAIPVDRTHIIGHNQVKATQCPGTLDIDRLVSMAAGILAPSDLQAELDKVRQARDSHWNDLIKIKDALNVTGEYSITTLLSRADQLSGYELEVGKKDKEIEKLREEVSTIQSALKEALQVNTEAQNINKEHAQVIEALKSENDDLQKKLENSVRIITGLGDRIEQLKQSQPIEAYSPWQLIVTGFLRLVRR